MSLERLRAASATIEAPGVGARFSRGDHQPLSHEFAITPRVRIPRALMVAPINFDDELLGGGQKLSFKPGLE